MPRRELSWPIAGEPARADPLPLGGANGLPARGGLRPGVLPPGAGAAGAAAGTSSLGGVTAAGATAGGERPLLEYERPLLFCISWKQSECIALYGALAEGTPAGSAKRVDTLGAPVGTHAGP